LAEAAANAMAADSFDDFESLAGLDTGMLKSISKSACGVAQSIGH
jgi:hypothetical protein